ncbi:hypothetical protein J4E91_011189 [Alternaria rosae]|nr:hypothetical protein J4E91_011189 [Alternaria rosae]
MCLALVAFFTLTDRPDTARWMTEDERRMIVGRIKSERLNQTELLDKIDTSKLLRGFSNPVTLAISFIFLLDSITVIAISFFLPTIVRTIYPARTVVQQQLLTVPPYIVGAVCTILITTVSWQMNSRQTLIALTGPFVIAGIAIGTNVFFGYVGALIASWTYLPGDSPRYAIGNGINLACALTWTVIAISTKLWMTHDNRKRDKRQVEASTELASFSDDEIPNLEWKHPAWRWKP